MVAAVLLLGTGFAAEPTLSQSRSTFPGRRVGGSTRGECAAREIIHLVPETSGGSAGLPPFDTVQYLNSSIRPMLVDALVQVGRQRSKEPSKAFATAVATSTR